MGHYDSCYEPDEREHKKQYGNMPSCNACGYQPDWDIKKQKQKGFKEVYIGTSNGSYRTRCCYSVGKKDIVISVCPSCNTLIAIDEKVF
jgi:hypothetical protein